MTINPFHNPTHHSELSLEDETIQLGWVSLIGVFAMVFVLLTTYAFRKRKTRWLPDSSIAMLIGMLLGCVILLLETRIQASAPTAQGPNLAASAIAASHAHEHAGHDGSKGVSASAAGAVTANPSQTAAGVEHLSSSASLLLSFSPKLFFFLLLPPIILDAGYSLKGRHFFQSMTPSLLLAGPGVMLSTLFIGLGAYFASKAHWFGHLVAGPFGILESLMFGALLSVTDSVATISILGSPQLNISQRLYSVIFGESVLNDAVGILMFDTLARHARDIPSIATTASASDAATSTSALVGSIVASFFQVLLWSVLLGAAVAFACSYLFRRLGLQDFPHFEFILVLMFAYASYVLALVLQLSGVVSIFVCGAVLARYNWYNLSLPTRTSTRFGFRAFSTFAELLVFLYLGLSFAVSIGPTLHTRWSLPACFIVLVLVILSRAFVVFPLLSLWNWASGTNKPFTFPMQMIVLCGGLRGAISFALALNMHGPHYHVMVTTTLFIVATTSLLGGAFTDKIVTYMGELIQTKRQGTKTSASGAGVDNPSLADEEMGAVRVVKPSDSSESEASEDEYSQVARSNDEDEEDSIGSTQGTNEHTKLIRNRSSRSLSARSTSHSMRNPIATMGVLGFITSSLFWSRLEENMLQPLFGGPKVGDYNSPASADPSDVDSLVGSRSSSPRSARGTDSKSAVTASPSANPSSSTRWH